MEEATLLRTADRNLRRKYGTYVDGILTAADIDGLETFSDGLAARAQGSPITITRQSFDQTTNEGEITLAREIWLAAAEEILADPSFNPQAPARAPRIILPDWRLCNYGL